MRSAIMAVNYAADALIRASQFAHHTLASKAYIGRLLGTLPNTIFKQAAALAININAQVARLSDRPADRVGLAVGKQDGVVLAHTPPHRAQGLQSVGEPWIK